MWYVILLLIALTGCEAPQAPTDGVQAQATKDSASSPSSGNEPLTAGTSASSLINGCDPIETPFGGGSGTDTDPYLICSTAQMAHSLQGDHYQLVSDLDYSGVAFSPMHGAGGTFDGQGHVIKNVTYDGRGTGTDAAFFFQIGAATVSHLIFDHISIKACGACKSAIVAAYANSMTFDDIQVTNSSLTPGGGTENGGIIGYSVNSNVLHSFTSFTFTPGDVGALVGVNYGGVDHSDSSASARLVYANENLGFVTNCGYKGAAQIDLSTSYNFGTVMGCN